MARMFLSVDGRTEAFSALSPGHGKSPCFSRLTVFATANLELVGSVLLVVNIGNYRGVQVDMESSEIHVTERPEKRSIQAKKGRHRYNLDLLRQIEKRLNHIEQMQQTIVKGLEGMFNFQKPFIQKIACADEVDQEILELLYQSQPDGVFPKDIALRRSQFRLNRFRVLRRLKAMNRRLEKELGQRVVEKRGHHWALTGFTLEIWGEKTPEKET
jgi:hypothetical protein